MKVFRELYLTGDPNDEGRLIATMESNLPAGWSRALDFEQRLNDGTGPRTYCFTCTAAARREAAALYLMPSTERSGLYVANIVPQIEFSLEKDQYNSILVEFFSGAARPAAEAVGWSAELTDDERPIEYWLGDEAAARLKAFSGLANKGTGSSHPLDAERWREFLILTHRAKANLDAARLYEWLLGQNWGEEQASRLAVEYEEGRDLLSAYDTHLQGYGNA